MHTLSLFPSLLTFGIFAPFLLRLIVGFFIISLGWDRRKKSYAWTTILYAIFGVLIILGLYTQVVVIFSIAVLKFDMYVDYWKNRKIIPVEKNVYFLYTITTIVLLSLLFTGPGAFAFDLPL